MYAIVNIAGQQFKVETGNRIYVHRLPGNIGDQITLDKVLLIDNEGKISIGEPYLSHAAVTAEISSHIRGNRVQVFKKKRRKGYRVLNGHRQYLTELLIGEISETAKPSKKTAGEAPAKEAKPTKAAVEKPVKEEKKATAARKEKPKEEKETKKSSDTKETGKKKETAAAAKKTTAKATTKKASPAAKSKAEAKKATATKAKKPATKKDDSADETGNK